MDSDKLLTLAKTIRAFFLFKNVDRNTLNTVDSVNILFNKNKLTDYTLTDFFGNLNFIQYILCSRQNIDEWFVQMVEVNHFIGKYNNNTDTKVTELTQTGTCLDPTGEFAKYAEILLKDRVLRLLNNSSFDETKFNSLLAGQIAPNQNTIIQTPGNNSQSDSSTGTNNSTDSNGSTANPSTESNNSTGSTGSTANPSTETNNSTGSTGSTANPSTEKNDMEIMIRKYNLTTEKKEKNKKKEELKPKFLSLSIDNKRKLLTDLLSSLRLIINNKPIRSRKSKEDIENKNKILIQFLFNTLNLNPSDKTKLQNKAVTIIKLDQTAIKYTSVFKYKESVFEEFDRYFKGVKGGRTIKKKTNKMKRSTKTRRSRKHRKQHK